MKISIITALKGENDSYLTCLLDYYQPLLRDNIELVIQDSSEKTSSLFFSPNRNISYEHYKDSSIYEAWNRAIIRAKGQIYLFLGSDDIPTPEYLHYLKNISLAKNEIIHSDASYTNKPFVFSDAKEIKRIMYSFNNKVSGIDFNCPPPFVAFSSKLFKEHKFNEEYKIISDGLFYFSIDHFYIQDKYEGTSVRMTHGGISNNLKVNLVRIDSEKLKVSEIKKKLKNVSGILIPGGFGKRGTEGKIEAIKYARQNMIPFLGICFGMQMAIIEFARNKMNIKKATSSEFESKGVPIIGLITEWNKNGKII